MRRFKKEKKSKKYIVLLSMVSILIITGIVIYNLQSIIFKFLYESNNCIAKQVYSLNKNNIKFNNYVDKMFSEKSDEYINKYKNNIITYEELKEYISKFEEYKDYNSKLEEIKKEKEKYEQSEQYVEQKNYKEALPIYIELNDNNLSLIHI